MYLVLNHGRVHYHLLRGGVGFCVKMADLIYGKKDPVTVSEGFVSEVMHDFGCEVGAYNPSCCEWPGHTGRSVWRHDYGFVARMRRRSSLILFFISANISY